MKNKYDNVVCPICGKYTFYGKNNFDICKYCGWENDTADGGANDLPLEEFKKRYERLIANNPKYIWKVNGFADADFALDSKKIIKLSLEYQCYPIWIYDEDDVLIDNDLPDELVHDEELDELLMRIQKTYDGLYNDTKDNFEYVGFVSEKDKEFFEKDLSQAVDILEAILTEKYIFENKVDIETL